MDKQFDVQRHSDGTINYDLYRANASELRTRAIRVAGLKIGEMVRAVAALLVARLSQQHRPLRERKGYPLRLNGAQSAH